MRNVLVLPLAASLLLLSLAPSVDAQDFSRIVSKARPAIALIFVELDGGGYASGTAFAVAGSPLLITAAHVIEDNQRITIRLADGTLRPGKPILVWHEKDIALIHAGPKVVAGLTGRSSPLRPGEPIIVIGYPHVEKLGLSQVSVTQGIISAVRSYVQLNILVNEGNSGGPVLDSVGNVVGVVSGIFEGTGLAVASPWESVATDLRSLRVLAI